MFLKNSDGEKSMTATFSIVAFIVVMFKILVSGSGIQVGSFTYSFGTIDASTAAAVLGTCFGTYAFRKYTEVRYGSEEVGSSEVDGHPGDGAL